MRQRPHTVDPTRQPPLVRMVTGRRSGLHQIGTNFDQYDGQPGPDPMSPLRPVVACTLCLACLTCTEDSTRSGPTGPRAATLAPTGPVLVGAGDIARCDGQGDEATAALLDGIPGTVFTAGNNVYGSDSVTPDFTNCYGPSWGRFKARTRPAVGSHEYYSPGAATYWQYFGAAAGDSGAGYYSYELGSWHIIVLNSGVDMRVASPQEQWLRADLAAHPALCTLAYWHHPRFSSVPNSATPPGPRSSSTRTMRYTSGSRRRRRTAPPTHRAASASSRWARVGWMCSGSHSPRWRTVKSGTRAPQACSS